MGGYRNAEYLAEVELFNWKTQKQCRLENLPYPVGGHTGVVLNGIPIYCGGQKNNQTLYSKNCYKFNMEDKDWTEVIIISACCKNDIYIWVPTISSLML